MQQRAPPARVDDAHLASGKVAVKVPLRERLAKGVAHEEAAPMRLIVHFGSMIEYRLVAVPRGGKYELAHREIAVVTLVEHAIRPTFKYEG
jgi:hypothetical protein